MGTEDRIDGLVQQISEVRAQVIVLRSEVGQLRESQNSFHSEVRKAMEDSGVVAAPPREELKWKGLTIREWLYFGTLLVLFFWGWVVLTVTGNSARAVTDAKAITETIRGGG